MTLFYETKRRFFNHSRNRTLITTANLTVQFGAKPLFENVSVKFGEGHRYGLIGANGCGKSTFMKILGGELEATSSNVSTAIPCDSQGPRLPTRM
jgi:ATPase subunit of ABC transporter with duplicated ATPase domains